MTHKSGARLGKKVPASTQNAVLAREIRFLKIKPVKYMRPIILRKEVSKMTARKAIEYLDVVLKAHPRLRPGDFGQAVKLGQEALKDKVKSRGSLRPGLYPLLPGEDPDDS